ncbi:MAG: right-handed parallel beta-helix repeat-containing protein, partial [bacterium]|nr:right-handed parallel beta-helix repeat-containing protein [bacterium]
IFGGRAYAQDTSPPSEVDTVVGTNVSGLITQNTTWSKAGSPYIVTGDLTIRHSSLSWGTSIATLTINPGVEVRFEPGTGIYVGQNNRNDAYDFYGALSAVGTADLPIIFTSNAAAASRGDWKGIYFRNQTVDAGTTLEHCVVEYGGHTNNANIYLASASPGIKNSIIRYSSSNGIYTDDSSSALISNNAFSNNSGPAINVHPNRVHRISGNTDPTNVESYIHVRGGTLTLSSTWVRQGLPYLISGDITIRHSSLSWGTSIATLTINPGAEIRFEPGTGIYVGLNNRNDAYDYYGALSAVGTAELPIIFTSNAATASPGDWKGIYFSNQTDDGKTALEHCVVEYGGHSHNANIYISGASPAIKNSTIRHSSGSGLFLVSSSPIIEGNIISENGQDGIYCDNNSIAFISANTINNSAGAAVNIHPKSVKNIRDNQGSGNGKNDIIIRGGEITSSSTWVRLNQRSFPYIITGDITIRHSSLSWGTAIATLIINPGVEIRFDPGTGIYVGLNNRNDAYDYYGALSANGTAEAPIVFTSNSSNPSPGDWKGIYFRNQTVDAETILEHCVVEYGGHTNNANIYFASASPTVKDSTVRHSSSNGLYTDDSSSALISNNAFYNNSGPAINVHPNRVHRSSGNSDPVNSGSYIHIRGGTLTLSSTWVRQGLPYLISGDITIRHSSLSWATSIATLTINPGVEIRFEPGTGIYVGQNYRNDAYDYYGALSAVGTAELPIIFTSNATTASPGDWKGIRFRNQTIDSKSLLEHCIIEYGGLANNANIYLENAKPTIQYNTIRNSSHSGIYVNGTGSNAASIRCNNLKGNHYGVCAVNDAKPVINSNNFLRNKNYGVHNAGTTTMDATNNWWNDINGPGYNGDDINGNVTVAPWLTAVSDCIDTPPTNTAPFVPKNPVPDNGTVRVPVLAEGEPVAVALNWAGGDPNPWDTVVYDLYFGTAKDSLVNVAEGVETAAYDKAGLKEGTTYYWKIVARDDVGAETAGPVWQFTTLGSPPDLVVSDIARQPTTDLQAGQTITFTATIENAG